MSHPRRAARLSDADLAGSAGTLLVAWCAVALGIALHRGEYLPGTLALVVGGTLLTAVVLARPGGLPLPAGLVAAAAVVLIAPLVFGPTGYSHGPFLAVSRVAGGLAGLAAAVTLRRPRAMLPALALAAIAGIARVIATPQPDIDVHFLLQDSTIGLLHGRDMYQQCWPGSNGLKCTYPYLPITSVLLLPARVLTGDVRYGEVAALVLAALWLRRLTAPSLALLPLLLIAFPQAPYSLLQAWTEPLLVACLAGMVLAVERGRTGLATLAFALALASKQHIALLVPLAALWPGFGWRRTLRAVALGVALVLPWILAGPRDFWHGAVTENLGYRVLPWALDIPALFDRHGIVLGFGVTIVAVGLAYALAVIRLPRTTAGFCAGGALVDWALDITNKQSFFNHYTLGMALLVMAVASLPEGRRGELEQAGRLVEATAGGHG
ncbi:MAG: hypothetical protein ACYDB7_08140 [Mycobacteriales bacterium]